ncbi:hypothetical protein MMC07_000152, partial [Pseudocyphellaria aurata]|nr:hypothetical protein [Pseudocyphellaria aurata]
MSANASAQTGPDLQEIQTEALGFQAIAGESKLRLLPSPWPNTALPPSTASLLSTASKKGIIAAAGPESVIVASTQSMRQAFSTPGAGGSNSKSFVPLLTLNIGMRVSQVVFSADENYLVISAEIGGGLAVYSVPSLMEGRTQPAFELSTHGSSLRTIIANPTTEKSDFFAVVTVSGELKIANLSSCQFIGGPQGQTMNDGVTCVSWSTRGKQLVAGLGNGTCVQMTPEGGITAEIPRPNNLEGDQHVTSISWLENDLFLVAHTSSAFHHENASCTVFHIITRQKSPQTIFTFQKLPEPCPSFGTSRQPPYTFMRRLKDFPPNLQDLVIVVSTAAPDVGLISRSKIPLTNDFPEDEIKNVFTTTTMANDARRAQLPMTEDFTDTSAIGVALDLSSTEKVKRPLPGEDMDESPGPLPGLMVLNNEGVLSFWWLVYADSIRQGLNYPGLTLQSNQDQGRPQAAAQQESTFGGASSNPTPARSQPPFGDSTTSAGNVGNVFDTPVASTFGVASRAGSAGFGTSSALGKPQSPWAINVSSNAASHSATPAFGQPAFGNRSTIGANAQGATFGMAGGIGSRASPWATQTSGTSGTILGQTGSLGMRSGNAFGSGPTGNMFGPGPTAALSSAPFSSFANSPGFAAAAAQSRNGGGFATGTTESVFGTGMDTDVSFGETPKQSGETSKALKNDGFVFETSFKGDGTAAKDLPEPSNNASTSLFGADFGDSLEKPPKLPATPPVQEEKMDDSLTDDENSSLGSPIQQEPMIPTTKPSTSKIQSPVTIPPSNGGFIGTQAQSRVTPALVESSAPATSAFGKPTPITTTPKESPRKSDEVPRPPIESTPTPVIKRESREDELVILKGLSTPTSELSLPPESTSKVSYAAGDTSSSSKSSFDDAPLPPDFLPSKSKIDISKETPQSTLTPPALDDHDGLEDDEGSGVDVAQDISPITDPNQSPRITPWSSYRADLDKSPPGGLFTKVSRQQSRETKPLFGEVRQMSIPYLPQPPKMQESPRSPSPVRNTLRGDGVRPVNQRSISAPGQPSKSVANAKTASGQSALKNSTLPPFNDQQQHERVHPLVQKSQEADEEQDLSDREDERIREELATEVEATKTLEPFVAHQDYIGTISKPGVPGQIETVYRDINSMIDTLGFNARSLTAFIRGQSELYQEGGRSRKDLETGDWCLLEIEDLGVIGGQLREQLEEGRLTAVQEKFCECRILRQALHKIRSKRYEISNIVNASSDPKQIEARNSVSLNPKQISIQNRLRKEFSDILKHIADAEERISLLRAKLAFMETGNGKKSPLKIPTVEAVTNTIKKMTTMVEKRNLDIDILETQMRKLRFSSVNSDGRESSSFLGSPASTIKSSLKNSCMSIQGEPNSISDNLSGLLRRSLGEKESTRNRMSRVTSQEAENYRLKVEQRKAVNEMVKKAVLSSGPKIRKLGRWPKLKDDTLALFLSGIDMNLKRSSLFGVRWIGMLCGIATAMLKRQNIFFSIVQHLTAVAMYAPDNSRRARTKLETNMYTLSDYEHLEVLTPTEERAGQRPVKSKRNSLRGGNIGNAGTISGTRIFKTRKRRDGKIFRAVEYIDPAGVMDETKEMLLWLLNHPNLVSLVAVVQDANVGSTAKSYAVWEDCNRGTLNRLLWHGAGQAQIELPESICWHVLDGISKALLWLHYGRKHAFPYASDMSHDDGWQPITITEITPANIYFTASRGNETYGDVKLGGFRSARVHSSEKSTIGINPGWVKENSPYMPPVSTNVPLKYACGDQKWLTECVELGGPERRERNIGSIGHLGTRS